MFFPCFLRVDHIVSSVTSHAKIARRSRSIVPDPLLQLQYSIPTTSTTFPRQPISTESIRHVQPLRSSTTDAADDTHDADANANEHGHELPIRYATGSGYASERHATPESSRRLSACQRSELHGHGQLLILGTRIQMRTTRHERTH